MHALLARYPALKQTLPYLKLAELPTPVSRADRLGQRIGLESLTIKQDDESGVIYGGNKVRKLEFLLADALARGCDAVTTFGGAGSNHALATAIYGKRVGLECYAVLVDQPVTPRLADTLRYHAMLGTHLVHAGGYKETLEACEKILAGHPSGSERVYRIPWGGSSWLGAVGFVAAALELADQIPGSEIPEVIYTACGTMGTAVGLALGLRLAGLGTRVEAVQVTPPAVFSQARVRTLFETINHRLHERDAAVPMLMDPLSNLVLRDEFFGPGYAEATPEAAEAVALMEETENLRLETTYTGKALAALIHDTRQDALAGKKVLFWNTYNSRPYPAGIKDAPVETLPEPLQKYLQ